MVHAVDMRGDGVGRLDSVTNFLICVYPCLVTGKINEISYIIEFFPNSNFVLIFKIFANIFDTLLVCLIFIDCPENSDENCQGQNNQEGGVERSCRQ